MPKTWTANEIYRREKLTSVYLRLGQHLNDRHRLAFGLGSPSAADATPASEAPSSAPTRTYVPNDLLTALEAGKVLGLSSKTLANQRSSGLGPPFIRNAPGRVRYRYGDLINFIEAARRSSTSDVGGGK